MLKITSESNNEPQNLVPKTNVSVKRDFRRSQFVKTTPLKSFPEKLTCDRIALFKQHCLSESDCHKTLELKDKQVRIKLISLKKQKIKLT